MLYLFSIIIYCKFLTIPLIISGNDNPPIVSAEFSYSNYSLNLTIKNNTNKPVYLQTLIYDKIKIYHEGKLINDADILYNPADFPPPPDPPLYDSTMMYNQLNRIGTFINYENERLADSCLLDYFINEYKKLNNVQEIIPDEKQIIMSYLNLAMFFGGGLLFLNPHESYTFKKNYSCFKRMIGNYVAKCKNRAQKYPTKALLIKGEKYNKTYKIPYIPPSEFMGFKRYDGPIKCKIFRFVTMTKHD